MFKKYQEKKYYSITLMLLFMLISTALAFLAFKFANINSANIALIYIFSINFNCKIHQRILVRNCFRLI